MSHQYVPYLPDAIPALVRVNVLNVKEIDTVNQLFAVDIFFELLFPGQGGKRSADDASSWIEACDPGIAILNKLDITSEVVSKGESGSDAYLRITYTMVCQYPCLILLPFSFLFYVSSSFCRSFSLAFIFRFHLFIYACPRYVPNAWSYKIFHSITRIFPSHFPQPILSPGQVLYTL